MPRQVVVLLAMALLVGCSDPRCERERFYCLSVEERTIQMQSVPDTQLIRIAVVDQELSRPPSAAAVYEMHRRGEGRARAIYYRYARTKVRKDLLDEMTRVFSREWDVCGAWRAAASNASKQNVEASCYRVFEEPLPF